MERETEVVIVGAGQAGLALSYCLSEHGIEHLLLERGSFVGEAWAKRYESLTAITPNWMNALPGLPFPGDPDDFPSRDEVVAYLKSYAERIRAPILFEHAVTRVTLDGDGFLLETTQGRIRARSVVAATGPRQVPSAPAFAGKRQGFQVHSDQFVSETQLPAGNVLVVGSGNSGAQIAKELSAHRQVWLARESDVALPRRLNGREFQGFLERLGITDRRVASWEEEKEADITWWMNHMGLYDMSADHPLAGVLAKRIDPYVGLPIPVLAAEHGIKLVPRATDADTQRVYFEDGSVLQPDIVIWATGYSFDYDWAKELPVTDAEGSPLHRDGISPVAGFYFLGLRWMRRWDSGQLKGVGKDAALLAEVIANRIDERPFLDAEGSAG